jgi:hypothetical protein
MGFGAIQATAGGFLLILALAVVWLACRLKQKNNQLNKALATLQRRAKEPAPIIATGRPAPAHATKFDQTAIADAFLWEHLGDSFLWKHVAVNKPVPIEWTRSDSSPIPTGLCDPAALQPLLEMDSPFTGLVVLVGIANSRGSRQEHPAQPFIEGLLGTDDFACRHGADEFLIICPGLRGENAQRHLNEISERLWNFQLRGQGSFSVLFSWGGINAENEPLSEAIASAIERMQQTKRSRVLLFRRKAG